MKKGLDLIEAALIGAAVVIVLEVVFAPAYTCKNQAKLMGLRHDWGFMQGCMVEHKPGKWIPLANYRVEVKE